MRRTALLAIAVICSGCQDRTAARIEVPSDTIIVNSTLWTPVGIRVLDERGESLPDTVIRYSVADTSLLGMSVPDLVNCHDDGSTVVTVRSGDLSARAVIRCRIVRRFGFPRFAELVAGGPPVPLDIVSLDADGKVMPSVRLQVTISDSTVVALRNGSVYGLKPGFATIEVGSSGRSGGENFLVRAAKDSVHSAAEPGEGSPLDGATSLKAP